MGDSSSTNLPDGLLFGLGNPLLDITATVDIAFLEKYHMKANDAILGGEHQTTLAQDMIDTYKEHVEYSAGGSCLNTFRLAQWHLPRPNIVTNTGCIGDDEFGRILQTRAREAGVNVQLQIDEKEATGSCAVLVTDKHRSLCAFLKAALNFKEDHLQLPEIQALIDKAHFYYTTGYFLVVSLPGLLQVAEHAIKHHKPFMFNISAGYVCEFYKPSLDQLLPYVDVVFGNDQEFGAFSDAFGLKTKDMYEVARLVHAMPKKTYERKRVVVITRGAEPALVCDGEGEVREYPAGRIPDSEIADTNGAGDGFVGGFLSQYIQRHSIAQCVACGHYTAGQVIRQHGVKVPAKPNFVFQG